MLERLSTTRNGQRWPVTNEYSLPVPNGEGDCRVCVRMYERRITRSVCYLDKPWNVRPGIPHNNEVIWPTWPTTVEEENAAASSPLKELQEHWDTAINRLRDSAKWMATVLGAALVSIIPASPLADLRQWHFPQACLGIIGLFCLAATMTLILRVMQQESVSYEEICGADKPDSKKRRLWFYKGPFYRWNEAIKKNSDLYLPCGIYSLVVLRQAMLVEEVTLLALARARAKVGDDAACEMLTLAQNARAARLHELRTSASSIIELGTFHKVQSHSTLATYGGAFLGSVGIVLIVLAVAWR